MRERIGYLDIAKGIGIILVVMGHCGFGEGFSHVIHAFHMPLFFVLSGFLYHPHASIRYSEYVKRKARVLLIPYFVFGIGTYLIRVITRIPDMLAGTLQENLLDPLWHLLWVNSTGLAISGEFWFLSAMFIASCLFELLMRSEMNAVFRSICVAFIALFGNIWKRISYAYLPWSLTGACVGIGLMYIGYLIQKNGTEKWAGRMLNMSGTEMLAVGVVCIGLSFANGPVNMRRGVYANIPVFWINAVSWSILTINLSKLIEAKLRMASRLLKRIGNSSIAYVCLNSLYITCIAVVLHVFMAKLGIENQWYLAQIIELMGTLILVDMTDRVIMRGGMRIVLGK